MNRPIPFGKYYLLERINVGGMAEVFRAKAYGVEGFERLLAVKRILPQIAADEEFIEMFIDEAKIAVQLNHANIAQIFDLGKVDDAYFIALEYIHGKDLRAIFDRCRSLGETTPIPQACFVVMKVCEGLDYAHNKRDSSGREMSLVHRDVSPQNVLVSYEGEVKLVDFGIAKAAGKASKTQAGILKGKFGYMSPEQVRGLPLDRRSDIFSMGIILYELLTGERLFLGETDFSTLEKVRNVEILPPSTYNRKISDELEQIVMRALAKDVDDRYQNAIDLHDDLQAYMYTSGEFYSRKDLAAWQKRTFAREIEEEGRKLEAYRQMPIPQEPGRAMPPPPPPPAGGNGRGDVDFGRREPTADFAPPPRRTAGPEMAPRPGLEDAVPSAPALTWDDDEIDTQIYDKPGGLPEDLDDETAEGLRTATAQPKPPKAPEPPSLIPRMTGPLPQQVVRGVAAELEAQQRASISSTLPVMQPLAPPPQQAPAKRKPIGLLLALFAALLLCGGGLYYFLVYAKRPGRLSITTAPTDAEIYVDGRRQPGQGTPLTVEKLKPGFYIVAARKVGFQSWEKTVEVKAGELVSLSPQLVALPSVELRTTPSGAQVLLDGQSLPSRTPMRITHIAPGRHRIEVRKPPKYQPTTSEIEVAAGETKKINLQLLPLEIEVSVKSEPAGDVFLVKDGQTQRYSRTPLKLKLNPKFAYRLIIRRDRYAEWSSPIVFEGEKPVNIDVKLEKAGKKRVEVPIKPVIKPKPIKPVIKPKPIKPKPIKPKPIKPKPIKPKVVIKPRPVIKPKPVVKPKPVIKPKGKGWLLINSKPWTKIIVDRRDTGLTTPQRRIPLASGKHTITLRNPKFGIEKSFTVFIRPNKGTKVIKIFEQR